jgi:hypothetical protein
MYEVKYISDEAFRNTAEHPVLLTSVYIPPTVAEIGSDAFRNVTTLESVFGGLPTDDYPDGGVKIVGERAFLMDEGTSSLTTCDMVSDESTALEDVYQSAFGRTAISSLYLSPTCRYHMGLGEDPYEESPFGYMGESLDDMTLPLSLKIVGDIEDDGLFQGLFYGTYCKSFTFYQDNVYEPVSYAPVDVAPGEVLSTLATEESIDPSVPALATPWYQSLMHYDGSLAVSVSFDDSVEDVPDGLLMIPDDVGDSKRYAVDVSHIPQLSTIGSYAFYNSYSDQSDGVLRLNGAVAPYGFYNPEGVTAVILASSARTIGPDVMVFDESHRDDGIRTIDLGGCTRCTVVKGAFKGVHGVQEVVLPPSINDWYTSAILAGEAEGDGWYRLGTYDGEGVLTKMVVTKVEGGRVSDRFRPAMRGETVQAEGRSYSVPRRFFREEADEGDVALGANGALNTSVWTAVKWQDVASTKWGQWSLYRWGELGQYGTLRGEMPSLLSLGTHSLVGNVLTPAVEPLPSLQPSAVLGGPSDDGEQEQDEPSDDEGELSL